MRTAPRRPSLSSSDAVNSVSARALADEQPTFGVGEQNRVGDGVDDVVQQGALAALAAVAFDERMLAQDLIELLAEDGREPLQIRRQRLGAADEQQAERFLRDPRHAERST